MWNSVGRSGHHRTRTCNGYDDWDGISENGHQYKNPITMETRDLSGADYWHLRKQNRPTEEIPMHLHMRGNCANINAYAQEDEKPKTQAKAKPKSAFQRANLADAHYERLEQLSQELDAELDAGQLSFEDWTCARKQLDKRLDRAWLRLCQAKNWNPAEKDEEIYSLCLDEMEAKRQQKQVDSKAGHNVGFKNPSFAHELAESLPNTNCFKPILKKLLTAKEKLSKIIDIIKQ